MVIPHPPAAHLSPAAQAFLRNAPPPPETCEYSDLAVVTALRAEIDPIWAAEAAKLDMAWVNREEFYGGVRCLRYASTEAALDKASVLVHFHGGSYIFGSPRVVDGRQSARRRTRHWQSRLPSTLAFQSFPSTIDALPSTAALRRSMMLSQ